MQLTTIVKCVGTTAIQLPSNGMIISVPSVNNRIKIRSLRHFGYRPVGMESQAETPTDECSIHPSVFYLLGTLLFTSCSTAMLCAAVMTDHWEVVTWDTPLLKQIANSTDTKIEFLLDEKVAKMEDPKKKHSLTFLAPMNGGIWTMCVTLSEEEVIYLSSVGFPRNKACINYMTNTMEHHGWAEESKTDWQYRMQNLSISCALVCLIVLGSAALVGAFGVCQHQISAVLVTGVMYLLAGLFALFTLMIIHFKRTQRDGGRADGVIGSSAGPFIVATQYSTAWSLELGWAGVALTMLTATLWILLSKIMRFNPISNIL